jgi:hypothetical protein
MEDVLKEYQRAELDYNEAKSGYDSANAQLNQLKEAIAKENPDSEKHELDLIESESKEF